MTRRLIPLSISAALTVAAAQPAPASWSGQTLARATFVIQAPQIQGNANVVNADQRRGILEAMKRDSAGALKRRYPGATISSDPAAAGAIRVTPVLVAPAALLPWNKLSAQWQFVMPEGGNVVLKQDFGVLTLWQKQAEAANYMYDVLAQRLP
ncbi:hypothetical protein [Deinococcus depolymerans]|uniref:Uncharacterized protein n=1 Tax=Deinococcus depolymerans TaxID=392408 RepID=A0ABP3MBN6_9DEIO